MAPLQPTTRPIKEIALQTAVTRLSQQLTFFVAGPEIKKDSSDVEMLTYPIASQVRLKVYKHVSEQLQHHVIFGEHKGVKEIGDDLYGSQSSFALTELDMAQGESCSGIIIIPASVGSFCELGAWSQYEGLCRKMLIVSDAKYKGDNSYFRLGAVKMATDVGAKLAWHDFSDIEGILSSVNGFVQIQHDLALRRSRTRAR